MTHVLATTSLHDGRGILSLAWSLVVISFGLALMLNYRGLAKRRGSRMNPRIAGGMFFASGLGFLFFAIQRFAQGGY